MMCMSDNNLTNSQYLVQKGLKRNGKHKNTNNYSHNDEAMLNDYPCNVIFII